MALKGKIIMIGDTTEYGENNFKKREFAIETLDEQYPQKIGLECIQSKCDLLDDFKLGDLVTVKSNLKGREWENPDGEMKYFNSLQVWKITKDGNSTPETQKENEKDENGLPF